jgi:hypothetical protein
MQLIPRGRKKIKEKGFGIFAPETPIGSAPVFK